MVTVLDCTGKIWGTLGFLVVLLTDRSRIVGRFTFKYGYYCNTVTSSIVILILEASLLLGNSVIAVSLINTK